MILWLYSISLHLYYIVLVLISPFHPKARKWVAGRRNWEANLGEKINSSKWIWFHCASLGEFEQGRPLMEAIGADFPEYKLLLTFYSPSGYEVRKTYPGADYVCYLPLDSPSNAQTFLTIVQPKLAVFVKYDLWIHFLNRCFEKEIPTLLISAQMQPKSSFLRGPLRSQYRSIFPKFRSIFTQNAATAHLLRDFSPDSRVIESSDTRFDRVSQSLEHFEPIAQIAKFVGKRKCLVGGSTWPRGEKLLFHIYDHLADTQDILLILAPHEIQPQRIKQWLDKYPEISLPFSQIDRLSPAHKILWIDNIGMLSRIYYYGTLAYIGGAWDKGLHNTLEAIVYGIPVFFGPNYEKYPEAFELIDRGIGFAVESEKEAVALLGKLWDSPELRQNIQRKCSNYIQEKAGATLQIVDWIKTQKILE